MTNPTRRFGGAIAAVILSALSACSGASGDPASSPASSPAESPAESAGQSAGAPAAVLKTVDPAALQALVDTTITDWLIPGAVVLVRTPQGEVTVGSGV